MMINLTGVQAPCSLRPTWFIPIVFDNASHASQPLGCQPTLELYFAY